MGAMDYTVCRLKSVAELTNKGYQKMSRLSKKGEEVYKHVTDDMTQKSYAYVKDGKVTQTAINNCAPDCYGRVNSFYAKYVDGEAIAHGGHIELPNGNTYVHKSTINVTNEGGHKVDKGQKVGFTVTPDRKISKASVEETVSRYKPDEAFYKTSDRKELQMKYGADKARQYTSETKYAHNYGCHENQGSSNVKMVYVDQPKYTSLTSATEEHSKILNA